MLGLVPSHAPAGWRLTKGQSRRRGGFQTRLGPGNDARRPESISRRPVNPCPLPISLIRTGTTTQRRGSFTLPKEKRIAGQAGKTI